MCCSLSLLSGQESALHDKSNERRPPVSIVWLRLNTITSSSELTLYDLELIAVNPLKPLRVTSWTEKRIHCPSFSRCPSPILHERAGDMQGGDGEIRREREPTLERTRSAGESGGGFMLLILLWRFSNTLLSPLCRQRPNGTSPPPRS